MGINRTISSEPELDLNSRISNKEAASPYSLDFTGTSPIGLVRQGEIIT